MIKGKGSDERAVSWKVLLPAEEKSKILAMGLTPEEVAGLSRSYRCVDIKPRDQKYDIAIIGKEMVNDLSLDRCLPHLVDGGMLIVCSKYAQRKIKRSGLTYAGAYAGLPSKKPRLFIPLASRKSREAGLSFHSPGSLRSKAWLKAAEYLNSAGIVTHLHRNTINIWTLGKPSNAQSIRCWISERAGWDVDEMVVYAGSNSADRKITVLAMSSDCSGKIIAKIADTDIAAVAIRQESASLRLLAQSSLVNAVPSLITEDRFGPYFIQLQTCLSKAGGQCVTLSDVHINFLAALSQINRESIPVNKTKEWSFINEARRLPEAITYIVSRLKKSVASGTKVDCHLTHGDFTPWNIIDQKSSILVYDWEDSNPSGFPYHDVFHFIYRQASLVGPWSGANAILKTMKHAAERLANMSKIICDPDLALSLWCVKEYLCKPDPRLVDLAGSITGIKHE